MAAGNDMAGMSRAEIDRWESKDFALGPGPSKASDAATLMLLDRAEGEVRLLMGRRSRKHAFMPGRLVFPGGRTDPSDGSIKLSHELHPTVETKLLAGTTSRVSKRRARAIALSAVRETYEEAGLLLGRRAPFQTRHHGWEGFVEQGVEPGLNVLRMVARAITPPGRVRRYDTRFLAAWRDDVAVALPGGGPTEELEELVWLTIAEARREETPMITRTILGDLERRLAEDPDLSPEYPVPYYRLRYGRFQRDVL